MISGVSIFPGNGDSWCDCGRGGRLGGSRRACLVVRTAAGVAGFHLAVSEDELLLRVLEGGEWGMRCRDYEDLARLRATPLGEPTSGEEDDADERQSEGQSAA